MVARVRAGMQQDGWSEGKQIPRRRAPSGICETAPNDPHFHRKARGSHEKDSWTFQQDVHISSEGETVCVNSEMLTGPDKVFKWRDPPERSEEIGPDVPPRRSERGPRNAEWVWTE